MASNSLTREPAGRKPDQVRPISIETGFTRYAEGSVLIRCGNTHVLCNASVEETLPKWLQGKGSGWVTAEYSMLPRSTHTRTQRDREKISGRTQEIQRLIGRSLRSMVDLVALGERSIIVDCDVIQADGGTRTASITGGCVALALALANLRKKGAISDKAWIDTVAAVSLGIKDGVIFSDLDYAEDSSCDVDMNFVVTGKNKFVEIQGTAEKTAFSPEDLAHMTRSALEAIGQIRKIQFEIFKDCGLVPPG